MDGPYTHVDIEIKCVVFGGRGFNKCQCDVRCRTMKTLMVSLGLQIVNFIVGCVLLREERRQQEEMWLTSEETAA